MMNSTDMHRQPKASGRVLYSGPVRLFTLVAAGLFCLAIILFPQLVIEQGRAPDHGALLIGLWGMAAGFVHGVGFVPRHTVMRFALGPVAACLLLVTGTLLLFKF